MALHTILCQIHLDQKDKKKKKKCHLPSVFQQHLPKSNIVVSSIILIGTSWLQPGKGVCILF